MKISKPTIDKILTVLAAAASAVLPALVDAHVLSSLIAADIGAGVTAVIGAYHGGAAVQSAHTTTQAAVK